MKPFNTVVCAVTLGCSAAALATRVNENNAAMVPVSVSITVAAGSLSAEWQPTTNLTVGSITDGTTLGHIQLSQLGTYAYRMVNYTDAHHPSQGNLVNGEGSAVHIPVAITSNDGQKNIEPSDHNGIPGWTHHANALSALKLTLRNISTLSPGTYQGAVEMITLSL